MSLRSRGGGHNRSALRTTPIGADELLGLPVRLHGIELARPVDLVLDRDRRRALGLEVRCGDAVRRFLPLAAAEVREDEIELRSPLVMLEQGELAFYTVRGSTLAALRGAPVTRRAEALGTLADLELAPDGTIVTVVVDLPAGRRRLPYGEEIRLGAGRSAVRAAS